METGGKTLAIADFSRFKHALVPGWFKNFLYDFRYKKISGAHFPPWNRLTGCALSESAPVRNPPGIYPTLKCIEKSAFAALALSFWLWRHKA